MAERPKDLIYALDEKPPAFELLALGFQHASAICPYLVMVALVAGAAKLPDEAARNALALAMVAVALLTILQSLRFGWVGSGYLCPPVVSANLFSFEHGCCGQIRVSHDVWNGDLCRCLRGAGRQVCQSIEKVLSCGRIWRGDHRCRDRAREDRSRSALRGSRRQRGDDRSELRD